MKDTTMKNKYSLLLWVSNMSVVGADSDYTEAYLRAAGARHIAAKHGVTLAGQTLCGDDAETLWRAYREMAEAVAKAGHGGDTEGAPAPTLTAKQPEAKDSAANLQEAVSQTAGTYAQWAHEALLRGPDSLDRLVRAQRPRNEIDETMKTKLTITHNGFHGYTTRSIVVSGNPGDRVELSPAQIKKLSRAACGMSDCLCGESMLEACEQPEPWNPEAPVYLTIPETVAEIKVNGSYPQR